MPLGYLLYGTFFDANNSLDFGGFARAYGAGRIGELWGNSLAFAGGSALLSLTVGTTLAYLNVRTAVPFKALFFAASIVPLIVPGILYTVSWIFLALPQIGLLNEARGGAASAVTAPGARGPIALSDDEIRERMSGNICRCGAYVGILAGIRAVANKG